MSPAQPSPTTRTFKNKTPVAPEPFHTLALLSADEGGAFCVLYQQNMQNCQYIIVRSPFVMGRAAILWFRQNFVLDPCRTSEEGARRHWRAPKVIWAKYSVYIYLAGWMSWTPPPTTEGLQRPFGPETGNLWLAIFSAQVLEMWLVASTSGFTLF